MKFKGKNFQPWAEFEMDIDKLTVLVGPSNRGKSSLFRALRGVFRNDLPAEYIRNNQDKALEVEIEANGQSVKASRSKKGSTKYVLNGDEKNPYTSLGGKIPEMVQKLNFGEIKIGDYTLDPIFAEQNKAQFLIDADRWKATELNAILGAFASTEKLDAGKKEANTRITQKNGEAKTLGAEIREAEERKAKLAEISVKAEEVQGRVHALEAEIRKLETVGAWVFEAISRRSRLAPLQRILNEVTLPDVSEAEVLYKQTQYLTQAAEAGNYSKWLRKVESAIVETGSQWSEIVSIYKKQKALSETIELLDKRQTGFAATFPVSFEALLGFVKTWIEEAVVLRASIKNIGIVQESQQYLALKGAEATEVESALELARSEAEKLQEELRVQEFKKITVGAAYVLSGGLCPKCGKPVEHKCDG